LDLNNIVYAAENDSGILDNVNSSGSGNNP
jgi:hypothetical protein